MISPLVKRIVPLVLSLVFMIVSLLADLDCRLSRALDLFVHGMLGLTLWTENRPTTGWTAAASKCDVVCLGLLVLLAYAIRVPSEVATLIWVLSLGWVLMPLQNTFTLDAGVEGKSDRKPSGEVPRHVRARLRRSASLVLNENWLELIDQAYFVCNGKLELVYKNRKARIWLEENEGSFVQLAAKLMRSEDPKLRLSELIDSVLRDEREGATLKAILECGEDSKSDSPLGLFRASLFRLFKANLCRINSSFVLIVLTEKKQSSAAAAGKNLEKATNCTLSHELKTLLNGVVGNLELLEEGVLDAFTLCHRLAQSSTHILACKLNDLLDNIQLQANDFRLHYTEFAIEGLVAEIWNICIWQAKQKQLSFETQVIRMENRTVLADQARLKQVLLNLVYKSIDFTDWGTISLHVVGKSDRKVSFKVISKGSGMHSKLLQQLKNASPSGRRQRLRSGTGNTEAMQNREELSLEISQLMCKHMRTRIIVKSAEFGQSQLKFSLPDGFVSHRLPSRIASSGIGGLPFVDSSKSPKSQLSATIYPKNEGQTTRRLMDRLSVVGPRAIIEELSSPREEIPSEHPGSGSTAPPLPSFIRSASPKHREHLQTLGRWQARKLREEEISRHSSSSGRAQVSPHTIHKRREKQRRTTMAVNPRGLFRSGSKCLDDGERCSVLIVDDNAINRSVLKSLLKRHGYNSIEANDGSEAVRLAEKFIHTNTIHEIEVVFMDLQMPTMNGIQATAAIIACCQMQATPPPPIIGVSSDPSEEDREKFLAAGIQEFISKPIDKQKVSYVIDKYMRKGSLLLFYLFASP